jgi:hypothetical protein
MVRPASPDQGKVPLARPRLELSGKNETSDCPKVNESLRTIAQKLTSAFIFSTDIFKHVGVSSMGSRDHVDIMRGKGGIETHGEEDVQAGTEIQ